MRPIVPVLLIALALPLLPAADAAGPILPLCVTLFWPPVDLTREPAQVDLQPCRDGPHADGAQVSLP